MEDSDGVSSGKSSYVSDESSVSECADSCNVSEYSGGKCWDSWTSYAVSVGVYSAVDVKDIWTE